MPTHLVISTDHFAFHLSSSICQNKVLIKNSSDLVSTLEEVNDRHSGVAIELQSIKKLMKTREASIKALTDNLLENFDEATVQSLCDHVGIKVSSKAKHETMISKLRIKFEEDHEGLLSYLQKKKSSTKKQKAKTKKIAPGSVAVLEQPSGCGVD